MSRAPIARRSRSVLVAIAAATRSVAAQPAVAPAHTAAAVAGAPIPGAESGRVGDTGPRDGLGRRVARALLLLPRVLLAVVDAPVRGLLWADDRYHLEDLYDHLFFNEAGTIGLVPTASYVSDYGFDVGASFVARDLFGEHEHLSVVGSTGGAYREALAIAARTGNRLGSHVELGLAASFERHPDELFYGIGNGDLVPPPPVPVNPLVDDAAVETRYREQLARVALVADVRPAAALHVRATAAWNDLLLGTSSHGTPIESVYQPAGLVGFGGMRDVYGELDVRWDGRHPGSPWDAPEAYATGELAAAFVGRVHRLDGGPDFTRYGGELQYFVRLGAGPRVLAARVRGEAVTGSRADVPLTELPELGGALLLRGYPQGRFRDRIAALGSLEYRWDLSHQLDAALFVDAGRVYEGLAALTLDDLRVGYGGELSLHGARAFLLAVGAATSIDGGWQFYLTFGRAFDAHPRWR